MYCINLFHYDYCFNNRIIYIVMTEELVTLETAKLLKDKGFNWKCEHPPVAMKTSCAVSDETAASAFCPSCVNS